MHVFIIYISLILEFLIVITFVVSILKSKDMTFVLIIQTVQNTYQN